MNLDINTLFQVTIYVEAILGLLLLFVWVQNTASRAVAWWGFAHLLRAGSVVLFGMYGSVPDLISIDLANAFLFSAFAVMWSGARVFDGRPAEPVYLVTGAVLWLLVCRLPVLDSAIDTRALICSGIITAYTWLAAYEFWHGRNEHLVSRWPAIFMLFAHGSLFLLRTPLVASLPWAPTSKMYGSVWLTVLSFEALLFTISIAFILLAMAKERTELQHKTASLIDPLTGVANRRAFLLDSEQLARRHAARPCGVAVLLIDLDHFKVINDKFGHAVGDRVLEVFAQNVRQCVRHGDLIGRLGGEEFAVVLYDVNAEGARSTAELIRSSFDATAREVDGHAVAATVSVGYVYFEGAALDVSGLLAQADQALYFAKERGRNCVEMAPLNRLLSMAVDASSQPSAGKEPVAARSAA